MSKNERMVVYRSRPLTAEQRARLKSLQGRSDEEIDFSDHPEADSAAVRQAVPGALYRALKQQTTLRIDTDVLDWFKQTAPGGKGYQTEINRVLREYVAKQVKKAG